MVVFLFLSLRNTDGTVFQGANSLAALAHFGLSHLDPDVKSHWRERIIAGPPYDAGDQVGILDYCASDVYALQGLLPKLVAQLAARAHWLEHALLRGRYMRAVARMEHTGIPVDKPLFERLSAHWDQIKLALIDGIRQEYPQTPRCQAWRDLARCHAPRQTQGFGQERSA